MKKHPAKLAILLLLAAGLLSCASPGKNVARAPESALTYNEGGRGFALTGMEAEVVRQVNDLRAHPKEWAEYLKGIKPGPFGWLTGRGDSENISEAVFFLEGVKPRTPFIVSKGLSMAAAALVRDHGPKGLTGHRGSDGKDAYYRMNSYGLWDGKAGENLYYGYKDADRLVTALLTEGGSQGLEQRKSIFSDRFTLIGIACGAHKVYGTMCVMDFAERYTEVP